MALYGMTAAAQAQAIDNVLRKYYFPKGNMPTYTSVEIIAGLSGDPEYFMVHKDEFGADRRSKLALGPNGDGIGMKIKREMERILEEWQTKTKSK